MYHKDGFIKNRYFFCGPEGFPMVNSSTELSLGIEATSLATR